jgi:hypothetical protein
MLTDNKTKQMCTALNFLTCYAEKGDEFLNSIVTGETHRVFHTFLSHSNEDEEEDEDMMWL